MTNNNKDFLIYLLYLVYTTYSKSVSLRNRLLEIRRRSESQFLNLYLYDYLITISNIKKLRRATLGSLRLEAFARWSQRREYCSWAQPETVSNQVNAPAMRSMHRRDSQCSAWSDRSPRVHVSRYRTSAPTANERGHTEAVRYALSPAAPPRLQASSDGLR